jgi:hypothetical protein
MLRCGRNHDRIDVDFATGNITHTALGALLVVDFQAGHKVFSSKRSSRSTGSSRLLAPPKFV